MLKDKYIYKDNKYKEYSIMKDLKIDLQSLDLSENTKVANVMNKIKKIQDDRYNELKSGNFTAYNVYKAYDVYLIGFVKMD